jgi:hypothetical protein
MPAVHRETNMNRIPGLLVIIFLGVTSGCQKTTPAVSKTDISNSLAATAPAATAGVPDNFCSPLGDPAQSPNLNGNNAFATCKVGDSFNTQLWGRVTQYSIRCKTDTLRSGWKWVIYCNADGTHCACNRDSIIASPSDATCCAFKAGDHCTVPGDARPGRNGCEAW